MKGDFTRDTFDLDKHYQQVLMQQGRAQLDADWNEQAAIDEHRAEITTADIIGFCGGPADGAAFAVTSLGAGDFLLGAGHYYVDGILCENEVAVAYTAQRDRVDVEALATGKSYLLYLDVWQRHITALEDAEIREPALGGPDTATRVKTIWQVRVLSLNSSVDSNNPCASGDLDTDPETALLTASTESEQGPDDPCIVPPRGGYAGLENQLYRVEIHDPGSAIDPTDLAIVNEEVILPDASSPQNEITVTSNAWTVGEAVELYPSKSGSPVMAGQLAYITAVDGTKLTLNVPVKDLAADDVPRIRHITGATWTGATWKWSRENGSVVTAIEKIDGNQITVSTLGPDANLGFTVGAWVEVLDDALELEGKAGELAQIDEVDESTGTITLTSSVSSLVPTDAVKFPPASYPDGIVPERYPKLRRWEGVASVKYVSDDTTNWLPLESGIQVRFASGGDYRTEQYWQIPARTATAGSPNGEIEWPLDSAGTTPTPIALNPKGITHHFCRLGIVTVDGQGAIAFTDCRCLYPALTAVPRLFYVGGDGQEVMPDPTAPKDFYKLPRSLIVGVANAQCLSQPLTVRFKVTAGNGRVAPKGVAPTGQVIEIATDAAGLASCDFHLDGTTWSQQVTAQLLDSNLSPVSLPIIFNANLSIASQVAYDPIGCGGLQDKNTVQDAIAQLASLVHIEMIGGDGQDCVPGAQLAKPLQVSVTSKCGPIKEATVTFTPEGNGTVTVTTGSTGVDGIATCQWTPDPALPTQQLTAKLENTPANQTIEKPDFVQFTANVRTEGSCCCVTVGEGSDFGSLEEALKVLINKQKRFDICICLLPGDHVLTEELKILPATDGESKQSTHVKIAGCGRNTRLFLKAALSAYGLASFSLIDLTIVETVGDPVIIQDCAEVTIKGCYLKQDSKTTTDFLIIGLDEDTQWDARSIATQILIESNVIKPATVNKTTATALVIADAKARTVILNNVILGQVRFYGTDGPLPLETFNTKIAKAIAGGKLLIGTVGRDAQIEGNSLQELVVDKSILPSDSRSLNGVFRRVSLLNNTLEVDRSFNEWLGAHVISNGNHFIVSDNNVTVGTACGSSFICVGTSASDLPAFLQYAVPNVKDDYRESANLIVLTPIS